MSDERIRITRSPGLPPTAEWATGEVAPRWRYLIEPRETPLTGDAPDPPIDEDAGDE